MFCFEDFVIYKWIVKLFDEKCIECEVYVM